MAKFAAEGKMVQSMVYISTGSNMGDRKSFLIRAKKKLELRVGDVIKESSIYETDPWGKLDQHPFLNQVLELNTDIEPLEFLKVIQEIEIEMGRERIEKWGSRVIDIDILFYNGLIFNNKELQIPHKYIVHRRFVLVPMNEIASEFIHPIENQSIAFLLDKCDDSSNVKAIL